MIRVRLTQAELAKMISSTRESVTHALTRPETAGRARSGGRAHDHPGPCRLGTGSRHVEREK